MLIDPRKGGGQRFMSSTWLRISGSNFEFCVTDFFALQNVSAVITKLRKCENCLPNFKYCRGGKFFPLPE